MAHGCFVIIKYRIASLALIYVNQTIQSFDVEGRYENALQRSQGTLSFRNAPLAAIIPGLVLIPHDCNHAVFRFPAIIYCIIFRSAGDKP
jgi:hypothetical protein